jgi:hypothetical protein
MNGFLKSLLAECEREHKASGDTGDWQSWYAAYMSPRLSEWQVNTYGSFAGAVSCPYAPFEKTQGKPGKDSNGKG